MPTSTDPCESIPNPLSPLPAFIQLLFDLLLQGGIIEHDVLIYLLLIIDTHDSSRNKTAFPIAKGRVR